MKATITIFAAVLTLQASILFAGNKTISTPVANESAIITLAPSAPLEATFEETTVAVIGFIAIAPATPVETDFNEIAPDTSIDLTNLAPVIPVLADFEDVIDVAFDIYTFVPLTPAADFE